MSARPYLLAPLLACLALGCTRPDGPRVRVVDLLHTVDRAEKRPVNGPFELTEHTCGTDRAASLSTPPVSRVIHDLRFPDHAVFVSQVAVAGPPGAAAMFRVGVSDDRIYEQLAALTVTADQCGTGWTRFEVDLRRFTGWKFSIFYQPSRRTWRLVLGINAAGGAPERAYWGKPGIETDNEAARRYFEETLKAER